MAAVTLQFATSGDLGSWAIRAYDHGSWSHVDAVLPGGGLLGARNDECAGIAPGVQIRPQGYYPFTATRRVVIPCNEGQAKAFLAFLDAQVGKPYDTLAIAGFVVGRDWRDDGAWFCSELQGTGLESSGIFRYRLATPANKLTPDGLFLACSAIADVWGEREAA